MAKSGKKDVKADEYKITTRCM